MFDLSFVVWLIVLSTLHLSISVSPDVSVAVALSVAVSVAVADVVAVVVVGAVHNECLERHLFAHSALGEVVLRRL